MPKSGGFGAGNPWLSMLSAQLAAGEGALEAMAVWLGQGPPPMEEADPNAQFWTSPNAVIRTLGAMRLREFRAPRAADREGARALVIAPFALHGASLVDFAPRHSLVEALTLGGVTAIVTEWRSATLERRYDTIDTLLADLNVAVDDIGAGRPLALIGLCQGGWLAAAYCARFPAKVARLALVGAPIDIEAERSAIADLCAATPIAAVAEFLRQGRGLARGRLISALWPFAAPTPRIIEETLQHAAAPHSAEAEALERRFLRWFDALVDLPGAYYLQSFEWIFRENRLARGRLEALGEIVDLARIACPLLLVAADDDEIVSPGQLFALRRLVATPAERVVMRRTSGRHLSLFMGRETLSRIWPDVAAFVAAGAPVPPPRRRPRRRLASL